MKRQKIGKGYYQSGYGRGFKRSPIIWLINSKAYARDLAAAPFQTDLTGYVMVNAMFLPDGIKFAECGLISEHNKYIES